MVGTLKLVGRVHEIDDREGFRAVMIDDTPSFVVVRDYKEDREGNRVFHEGDYVRVFGTSKKSSKSQLKIAIILEVKRNYH